LEEEAEKERRFWNNSGDDESYGATGAYTHAINIVKGEGLK
jgi:hypothetical protein